MRRARATTTGEDAYTYVFDGQLGYLDYAFASASLIDRVTVASAWAINADEPNILDYDMTFKQPAQGALRRHRPRQRLRGPRRTRR